MSRPKPHRGAAAAHRRAATHTHTHTHTRIRAMPTRTQRSCNLRRYVAVQQRLSTQSAASSETRTISTSSSAARSRRAPPRPARSLTPPHRHHHAPSGNLSSFANASRCFMRHVRSFAICVLVHHAARHSPHRPCRDVPCGAFPSRRSRAPRCWNSVRRADVVNT